MACQPHDDLPTLVDKLSWETELDDLCDRIMNCKPPHVFGVHGDWGAGKTSFMRQLQWRLGGTVQAGDGSVSDSDRPIETAPWKELRRKRESHIATVWFEAWRYQNEPVPVVALLHEMRRQLGFSKAVAGKLKKFAAVGGRYMLGALGDAAKLIGAEAAVPSADKIEQIGEKWEKTNLAAPLPTDSIRGFLSEAIKTLLPNGIDARLIVFIDDLDRCNSSAAFRLLEGLKIYLNVPGCVFVIGMNEQTLVDTIGKELSIPKDAQHAIVQLRAAHYLEKICTNILRLPPPPNSIDLLANLIDTAEQRQSLQIAIGDLRCLPPNPRRLKALANQWMRFAARTPWPVGNDEQQARSVQVLVVAYIYQFHRDLWERWCFQPAFWDQIRAWCCGELVDVAPVEVGEKKEDRPQIKPPEWIGALKLPERRLPGQGIGEDWGSSFPDPNAIEIFWIAPLVRQHREKLLARDLEPLLKNGN